MNENNRLDLMMYHTQLVKHASLGNMKINLTNKQFEWLAEGSTYNESNLALLRKHYVEGVELKTLAQEAGFSSPARIYTLVKRWETFIQKKLDEQNVEISAIMHRAGEERFLKFDVSDK
ncbi:MAG: hypothetical protein R3208_19790 [Ketobacteraceae bacterium]|nr:hypothetical protein [Ketobacteraceae bacterium]